MKLATLVAALLFSVPSCIGVSQTIQASTQPQTAVSTAPVIPAGTVLCSVPKNGGPCKAATTIVLPPVKVNIASQIVTLTVGTLTYTVSCTGDLQNLSCTAVQP